MNLDPGVINMPRCCAPLLLAGLLIAPAARAEDPPEPTEADYYTIHPLPIPDGVVLEAGALEMLPDGRLAASSRRGEIYLIENPWPRIRPRRPPSNGSPTACTKSWAWPTATAGSTPPSAAS